jgi:hypothetical protein
MNEANVLALLRRHLPPNAVDYCFDLWERNSFIFKVKNPRRSKLGDYRYIPSTGKHYISVNSDLNPYSFLVTYLHEVAHLLTFRTHGRKAKPHGSQWKRNFRDITFPLLTPAVFPSELLPYISRYISNPATSSCSDPALMVALRNYDLQKAPLLKDLQKGDLFHLHTRIFKKGILKRTRYVCQEVKTGRSYLISGHAPVQKKS